MNCARKYLPGIGRGGRGDKMSCFFTIGSGTWNAIDRDVECGHRVVCDAQEQYTAEAHSSTVRRAARDLSDTATAQSHSADSHCHTARKQASSDGVNRGFEKRYAKEDKLWKLRTEKRKDTHVRLISAGDGADSVGGRSGCQPQQKWQNIRPFEAIDTVSEFPELGAASEHVIAAEHTHNCEVVTSKCQESAGDGTNFWDQIVVRSVHGTDGCKGEVRPSVSITHSNNHLSPQSEAAISPSSNNLPSRIACSASKAATPVLVTHRGKVREDGLRKHRVSSVKKALKLYRDSVAPSINNTTIVDHACHSHSNPTEDPTDDPTEGLTLSMSKFTLDTSCLCDSSVLADHGAELNALNVSPRDNLLTVATDDGSSWADGNSPPCDCESDSGNPQLDDLSLKNNRLSSTRNDQVLWAQILRLIRKCMTYETKANAITGRNETNHATVCCQTPEADEVTIGPDVTKQDYLNSSSQLRDVLWQKYRSLANVRMDFGTHGHTSASGEGDDQVTSFGSDLMTYTSTPTSTISQPNLSDHLISAVNVKQLLHDSSFRLYCDQIVSAETTKTIKALLADLIRFQDRLHAKDPNKARIKRRLVCGLSEARKRLQSLQVQCVILAPNIAPCPGEHGLDVMVDQIVSLCRTNNVPLVIGMSRRNLGKVCLKKLPVSCVAILNYQGSENNFKELMRLRDVSMKQYETVTEYVRAFLNAPNT